MMDRITTQLQVLGVIHHAETIIALMNEATRSLTRLSCAGLDEALAGAMATQAQMGRELELLVNAADQARIDEQEAQHRVVQLRPSNIIQLSR